MDGSAYEIMVREDREIEFKALRTGETFGPYDLIEGRIMRIGKRSFTLIDIEEVSAPLIDEPVLPAPSRPPALHTSDPLPAVRTPPSVGQPRPARYRPRVPPSPSDSSVPSAESMIPKRKPRPRQIPVHTPAPLPPPKPAIGLFFTLVDSTYYDAEVAGTTSRSSTTIDRRRIYASVDRAPFMFQAGLLFSSEWDESVDGPNATFEDAGLADGSGWYISAGLQHTRAMAPNWKATFYGEASFQRESLTLQYDYWTSSTVINETNGVADIPQTSYGYASRSSDATLTEWVIQLGARIAYQGPVWGAYGALQFIPLSDTSLDATIDSGPVAFDIELDRTHPFLVLGGLTFDTSLARFVGELRGGEELRLTLGAVREF